MMQSGKILLLIIIFPIFSTLTIFVLREELNPIKTPQVLAAKTKKVKIFLPSLTPAPSANLTVTPTAILTPSDYKKKVKPTIAMATSSTDYILQEINAYRQQKGLPQVSSNTETCNFAKVRAEEISNNFTHDGFNKRVSDKNLPYPSYHEVTENIAYNTDYTDVVIRWIASPGHEENIRKDTPFICIGKYGDYYAFEGWRP